MSADTPADTPADTARTGRPDDPLRSRRELDLGALRERLAGADRPAFWRHLDEVADEPEFQELLHREFPAQAAEWADGVDRRRFLQLMGASLALGGLTACTTQPPEEIVPYVEQPEQIVPGRPLHFATTLTLAGYGRGVLVESHMGRPTKIEGNPDHPASRGATDLFAQAAILEFYDPDRSQTIRQLGRFRSWATFVNETRDALAALEGLGGARVRILTGTVTSPTVAAEIERFRAAFPRTRWVRWEPAGRHSVGEGLRRAFGEPLECRWDLSAADAVVSLDADLVAEGPAAVAQAGDLAARRRLRGGEDAMSRLWVAESSPTLVGTVADHRLALPPHLLGRLAVAIAAAAGVPGVSAPDLPEGLAAWARAAAADLAAHRGRGAVVPGEHAAPEVHVLAHATNAALGNLGTTALLTDPVAVEPGDQLADVAELAREMRDGEVDVLITVGGNPVYDAPADVGFADAMLEVPRRIRLGLWEDETSAYSQWHLPMAHELESWGDARAFDGTASLAQPLIEPLYGGRGPVELLSALGPDGERSTKDAVRALWEERLGGEAGWRRALHDGVVAGTALPPRPVPLVAGAAAEAAGALAAAEGGGLELVLRPDPTVGDGRFANNGWLQECPKPATRLTWDNAALLSPATAERLGVATEDVVLVGAGQAVVEAPVWVQPGHPDGSLTLHLGHGRTRAGVVGDGVGADAYRLRTAASPWSIAGATVTATGRTHPLASTQLHHNIEQETEAAHDRHLVRVGTLAHYRREPDFARHLGHDQPDATLYPPYEYDGYAWGLAIDLSACTGCNACVVACQAENNVPVVGKEQVLLGREMHWLRIDRYFEGDLDAPSLHNQPVMCMHCEQAPCEVVCPVAATVHSAEGLNDMVYNRCVGTRYCSNNCPYKVRRFNFLKYNDLESPILEMMRNPDVTVRTRGVMEKCTYCVQRISGARIEAKREGRRIRDGEVRTACQQVCPSGAIAFGDINDPDSEVSSWKGDPLGYGILEELNTRPRTTYLAKVTNPSAELAGDGETGDGEAGDGEAGDGEAGDGEAGDGGGARGAEGHGRG